MAFVPVAGSSEMGGDLNVITHVAWLENGFAVLTLNSYYSVQEPVLSVDLKIVDRLGSARILPSIRFEDDALRPSDGEEYVISTDELYTRSEYGDREKTILDVAAVLVERAVEA